MAKYNHNYRKSSENLIETLKIAIKRNSVEREVSEVRRVNTKDPPVMMDSEEIFDLIPPFSPSSSDSLSAEEWIETIEDLKVIYGWDDRLTLVYASLRLQDAAKRWFKENPCDWPEFKVKLVRRFSNRISKSQYFEQLLHRRKEYNESFENYVYDVERTALKCDCSVESTINYIISGLRDSALRSQLIACNCKTVDVLLSRIKTFTAAQKNNDDMRSQLERSNNCVVKEAPVDYNALPQKVCYKCKKRGHYASDCWSKISIDDKREGPRLEPASKESVMKRAVMCVKCNKLGHYASDCYFNVAFCNKCNRKGHNSYDCRFKEDKELLEERRNPRDSENFFRADTEVICVKCNIEGHHAKDCNFISKDCYSNEVICHICNRKGHKSYECRFNKETELRENTKDERHSNSFCDDRKINNEVFRVKCKVEGQHTSNYNLDSKGCNLKEAFCQNCKRRGHNIDDCWFKANRQIHEKRSDEHNSKNNWNEAKFSCDIFCVKCKTEGHLTKDCNFNSQSYFNEAFCNNCNRKGHTSIDCRLEVDKHRDEMSGDRNSELASPRTKIKREVFCLKCRKQGHYKRDCNANEMPLYESGHISKDCPTNLKHFEEIPGRKRNEKREKRGVFCQKCRLNGHYTKDCKFNVKNDPHLKEFQFGNKEKLKMDRKKETGDSKKLCYNCRQSGHYAKHCTLNNFSKRHIVSTPNEPPAKKICFSEKPMEQNCLETKFPNQFAFECQQKPVIATKFSPIESLNASIKPIRNISELLKPVRIENVYVTALVNLASDCTTLQRSEFEKHDWKIQPCNLELNGLSAGPLMTLGKISKNVCLGEVELMIDILVVEDHIQDFPLVLGSNFLDHPSVCVIKKYRSLEVKLVDSKSEIPAKPALPIEEQLKIKSEPDIDVEEQNLLELLDMIKQDCS